METAVAGSVVGATIKVVLENLLSSPVEEIGLLWNFNKHSKKLKQSMDMILNFLEDAEMKQVSDKPVQRWLMKLESVAYDTDYVLDELNYQPLRKKVKRDYKMKKKVSSFFSASNPIVFRHRMARKIKKMTNELKSINQEASGLGLQMRVASAHGAGIEAPPAYLETDSFAVDRVFVGRENDVKKMVKMVTSSPSEQPICVFTIVGLGGLGKTTLTRKVFSDADIISHFGERIWVHVPENFDPLIVLKKTLESLTGENVDGSREVVLRKLGKSLGEKRYLLVLDNVWNEETDKWDNFLTSLEGISPVKGNVIMVTTRKTSVASIVKSYDIHELRVLSEEDCWFIIKSQAFGGECVPLEFESIGRNVAKRCGGLPLAAKVVGSLLYGKSKDEWVSIENKWLSDFEGNKNIVSKILKLSFDNLPWPSLKKCFTLCSIIPKGYLIDKDALIHLWMAEGLLPTDDEKDMEIVGHKVFNILLQSSLLQGRERDSFGNVKYCDMHDLVRALASSLLNPKSLDDAYQVRYIDNSSPIPKEYAKYLRSLLVNGKASHIIFTNFKCLHVLYLIDEHMKELPSEIGMLISLRVLHIANTRIECLPDSIGDLYHLQTLIATNRGKEGYLRKLPDTLKYLISLRHLYIPNIKLPPGIGNLVSLQTLHFFQVGDEECCGIMELGSLMNLRGEIEIHSLEKVRDKEEAKSADLFHKPNLIKLKLVWSESREGESNDENVLEGLQPHPNLKSLEIKGFKGRKFPSWTLQMEVREEGVGRFDNLIEIKLSSCKECEEIPMLGHLLHLKCLYLHHLSNVKSIGSSFYGIKENGVYQEAVIVFPALEKIELIEMPNLTAWAEVELACDVSVFGRLEYLKISECRQLMSAPTHFPCLKELEIDNMESGLALANICGSKLTSLTKLIINKVDGLVCLQDGLFYNNRDLLDLDIRDCNNLTHLVPCLGGGGASLKKLVIVRCSNFKEFPEDLYSLTALEELSIARCPNITSIAYPSSSQGFTSLRHLEFSDCTGLTNFPCEMLESCAPSLEVLWLTRSKSLTNFPQMMSFLPQMRRLVDLGIQEVPKFTDVAAKIGSVCSLHSLRIGGYSDCRDYVSFKASLDLIFPELQSLRVLVLQGMEQWDAIPDQLKLLTTLQKLRLDDFGVQVLPEWLGKLSSLRSLELWNCKKLRVLPSKKAIQSLTKLTALFINNCPVLKQNLEVRVTDDSEWFKISHIAHIEVDGVLISAPAH